MPMNSDTKIVVALGFTSRETSVFETSKRAEMINAEPTRVGRVLPAICWLRLQPMTTMLGGHVGRQALIGLCVAACLMWSSGCSNSTEPTTAPTSASVSPSATPSARAATEFAMATGRVDVAEIPDPLVASSGSISISSADDGGLLVNAIANGKRGQAVWALTLTVTNQGKAANGTLVAQGQTWNVTPGTGEVSVDRGATTISMTTVRAVTLTGALTPKVNTPLVVALTGSAPASQQTSAAR